MNNYILKKRLAVMIYTHVLGDSISVLEEFRGGVMMLEEK